MRHRTQTVEVDILEPACRETHHVLLLFALSAVRVRPRPGTPRTRFLSSRLRVMDPLRGNCRCLPVSQQDAAAAPLAQEKIWCNCWRLQPNWLQCRDESRNCDCKTCSLLSLFEYWWYDSLKKV